MNAAFERRLTIASAVVIGGAFVSIVVLTALFALSMYVGSINRDITGTLASVRTILRSAGQPGNARVATRILTAHAFDAQVQLAVFDQQRHIEFYRRAGSSTYTIRESRRNDVERAFPPNTLASRSLFALSTLLGLSAGREDTGPLLVAVHVQERALATGVLKFLPLFGLCLAGAAALGIVLARVLATQALRPLNDVTRALQRLATGDLTPHLLPAHRESQLRDLTAAYNGAVARVQSAFDERDEAHGAMEQFIADAGHQLRTPLTVVRGFIGILTRGSLRDVRDFERILQSMNRQCIAMGSLIEKLILLDGWERSRVDDGAELVDVSQLVEDVVTPIAEAAPAQTVRLNIEPGVLAFIDPIGCSHALTNVVDNAIKYAPGQPVDVTLVRADGQIRIDIVDHGPGMAEDEVAHAFDRFYRGSSNRAVVGSGLGLPIARRAIERARGTIDVESRRGEGCRFIIRLPLAQYALSA